MIFFARGRFASVQAAFILTILICGSIGMTFAASWILGRTVLRGEPSSFVLELPPYRKPEIGKVIVRSLLDRTAFVLGRAVLTAAPAGILIWLCANISISGESLLTAAASVLSGIGGMLGLDGTILLSFLLGIPANEIVLPVAVTAYLGAGVLTDYSSTEMLSELLTANGWTACTAVCYLVFTLFHWPCATTLLTIRKETKSTRLMLAAWILPTLIGVTLCMLIHAVFGWIE
ncbi:MAG: ferrous iron transporter B [Oscillospiraceae bacterium]|nr:ferrous iron transporter B [Oscillospiraceae bacterium]